MTLKSKVFLLSSATLLAFIFYWNFFKADQPKLNPSYLLATKIREGDYVHAGDKDAFRFVLPKIVDYFKEQLVEQTVLDVGCGLGGTANYFYVQGFYNIWGIDIDKAGIDYASSKYPFINFSVCDVKDIANKFEKNSFSLIYSFNVFYILSDQEKAQALNALAEVAKPGALLVIFDCTHLNPDEPHGLKDFFGNSMYPIVLSLFHEQINKTKWEIIEEIDLTANFITWSQKLLHKADQQKSFFTSDFSAETISNLSKTYIDILTKLQQKTLGGIVIYAKRKVD
ncbi:MAG: methyltransferase domain-containing protein [Alphaproteobacteria bacterium]|nr:methyltransferase domain-containing protein [Alphaproteobacteria bacterium]